MEKCRSSLFLKIYFPTCLGLIFFITALLWDADCQAENVTLAWDPSPDPVISYTVFYGEQSVLTNPSTPKPAGKALTCTIDGLLPGHTYYFALKAYYYNNESGFSNEATYTVPASGTATSSVATTTTTAPPVCTDNDGDGYGVGPGCAKTQDCDEADQDVHPEADEICEDGIDNNCNGLTDEDCDAKQCPVAKLLGDGNPNLANLRFFRDTILAKNAIGRKIISIYYNNTDSIDAALDSSPALRAAAKRVLEALVPMVGEK